MITINIATKNSIKLKAIEDAFKRYYWNDGIVLNTFSIETNSSKPINEEIMQKAITKLEKLKTYQAGKYDILVSCESGLVCQNGYWFNQYVTVIETKDSKRSVGLSQSYQIPEKYLDNAMKTSVANVIDGIFRKRGGVKLLTKGYLTTGILIEDSVTMALIGIINGEIW